MILFYLMFAVAFSTYHRFTLSPCLFHRVSRRRGNPSPGGRQVCSHRPPAQGACWLHLLLMAAQRPLSGASSRLMHRSKHRRLQVQTRSWIHSTRHRLRRSHNLPFSDSELQLLVVGCCWHHRTYRPFNSQPQAQCQWHTTIRLVSPHNQRLLHTHTAQQGTYQTYSICNDRG